jgi:hypothetical protein
MRSTSPIFRFIWCKIKMSRLKIFQNGIFCKFLWITKNIKLMEKQFRLSKNAWQLIRFSKNLIKKKMKVCKKNIPLLSKVIQYLNLETSHFHILEVQDLCFSIDTPLTNTIKPSMNAVIPTTEHQKWTLSLKLKAIHKCKEFKTASTTIEKTYARCLDLSSTKANLKSKYTQKFQKRP